MNDSLIRHLCVALGHRQLYPRVKTLVDDYPLGFGLEALSYAFAGCGMRSVALRGSMDELLADWPKPLLLVLGSGDEAGLAVLVSANDEEVILFDAEGRRRRAPIARLADVWSGVAVVFDREGYSPRPPEGRIRQKLQSVRLRRVCLYVIRCASHDAYPARDPCLSTRLVGLTCGAAVGIGAGTIGSGRATVSGGRESCWS